MSRILHVSLVVLVSSSNGPPVPWPLKSKLAELLEANFVTSATVYSSNVVRVVWMVLNKAISIIKEDDFPGFNLSAVKAWMQVAHECCLCTAGCNHRRVTLHLRELSGEVYESNSDWSVRILSFL
jgi:hypothetical protein